MVKEELLLKEHEFSLIFEINPDGIITVDNNNKIVSINPSFERLTGIPRSNLAGLNINDFYLLLIENGFHGLEKKILKNDDFFVEFSSSQHPFRRHSDNTIDFSIYSRYKTLRVTSKINRNGAIYKVFYFHDVTKETHINRMKSDFLSIAAHELRTPMTNILGFSELLLSRKFKPETSHEIHQIIYEQSSSLVGILNDLLDLARIESGEGHAFFFIDQRLNDIAHQTVKEAVLPDNRRTIIFNDHKENIYVSIDVEKFKRALINVINNAIKYSAPGCIINVDIDQRKKEKFKNQVGVRVRDHGRGMSQEEVNLVFKRFWRADKSGQIPGTGLGMSLVKEIMDAHQGEVEINSTLGSGTTVTLWLNERVAVNVNVVVA